MELRIIGKGDFGDIYEGIFGQDAIEFILENKGGEVKSALVNTSIENPIDIVYGKTGNSGYGLAHINERHPEILSRLSEVMKNGKVVDQAKDRKLIIADSDNGSSIAVIRLDWNGKNKTWIVSAFEKL